MNCPGCTAEMQRLSVDGKLERPIQIDLCAACRLIWFDQHEDLRLAPTGTLRMFEIISKPAPASAPLPSTLRCPRCRRPLEITHDVQRNTRFQYWRCGAEHGRLMTFLDFLREKDFVRPLSRAEIAQLGERIKTVNCGNCGGPIDLAKDTVCSHCGSALSILDPDQMARTVAQLRGAPAPGAHQGDFSAVVDAMKAAPKEESRALIDVGLRVLAELLKKQ
jgi:hypothetical protein